MSLLLSAMAVAQQLRAAPQGEVVKVTVDGKRYIGKVIGRDSATRVLLQRNGHLRYLSVGKTTEISKYKGVFRSYSAATMRARLLEQIPKGYEVTNTGSYVVVHPQGKADQWAFPFEKLSRRFTQYFTVRGFNLKRSEFPLVVVVYATRGQFLKTASKRGVTNPGGVSGFYSPTSNQVITYVQASGLDQQRNANHLTLIHEALHQFAFNKGLHSRWSQTPKWTSEGMAVMFEAPGVYDSGRFGEQSDRVHAVFVKKMKKYIESGRINGVMGKLIESDRVFQDAELAYTASWALMFYLSENQPRALSAYLTAIGNRPDFTAYDSTDRLQDFATHFGAKIDMLESRVIRFIDGL